MVRVMARMHSKSKGKSGSTKPDVKDKPDWVKLKPKEIEDLVVSFAKEGMSPSVIGITLRDQYGIPSADIVVGKTITQILKDNKLQPGLPEDLGNLIRSAVKLLKHLELNKKDRTAKRGHQLTVSKIRRLAIYYKGKKLLPMDWKYSDEKAALLVR